VTIHSVRPPLSPPPSPGPPLSGRSLPGESPEAFRREIRDALRYEKGLAVKAALALAVLAVIVVLRTLYFGLRHGRGTRWWHG
jgi:hypothetical protein